MAALKALIRLFSYLFHGLLALFLLGIAIVSLSSREPLHLPMLPWEGHALTWWVLGAGLLGLVIVIRAIAGRWRALFFLWSLVVFGFLLHGFFFSSYHFAGPAGFHNALYLMAAALIAVLGAWFQLRREQLR